MNDNIYRPISKIELAKGFILCRDNSERLINDAELLYKNQAFLSSINNCRLANEEISKAVIIYNASTYDENDKDKWEWFNKSISDHKEKLRVLEYSLHWPSYKDKNRFNDIINFLKKTREKAIYVEFDKDKGIFSQPGDIFKDIRSASAIELFYSRKIHQLVFLAEYLGRKRNVDEIVEEFQVKLTKSTGLLKKSLKIIEKMKIT